MTLSSQRPWPDIPYKEWEGSCKALHLWSQIVGKYRLAHTPWVNHSWHATLYVTPRGLTTGTIPDSGANIEIYFDLKDHRLVGHAQDGAVESFALEGMSVADFYTKTQDLIRRLGGTPHIHHRPNEIPNALPFLKDIEERPYDPQAVEKFHLALTYIQDVFTYFRSGFLGKASPVHLFWGSFDLAVTRFSGRLAPRHPGGIPNLPDNITEEAYSHEVSSAGFWPGGNGTEAMFYAYAYPTPTGFKDQTISPKEAYFDDTLGEFLLPYKVVQQAADPTQTLMDFLQSTYEAAARLADWDQPALECEFGQPRRPRAL
ncbi:MAG: DUF5996 family protein [Pseudomonadota bacterium]